MRKKDVLKYYLLLVLILILSGCSAVRERLTQALWERSGAAEEIDYVQYEQMRDAHALDDEGLYRSEKLEQHRTAAQNEPAGTVRVSFARNEFLDFEFYRDSEFLQKLEPYGCMLGPGDVIYASAPVLLNTRSEYYQFSEMRVQEIDGNGNYGKILAEVTELPGPVFRIPENYEGKDIVIIPLGAYRDRTVSLNAVFAHPDGSETVLEKGIWMINGKQYGNGRVKLNPMESYRIVFDYRFYRDNWYYDGSVPDSYWDNSRDATITFLAEPSGPDNVEYKVRLHPYGSLTVLNGVSYQNVVDSLIDGASNIFRNKNIIETQNIISLLQVNGVTHINNFSDTEVRLPDIKAGDEILLRVPGELKVIAEGLVLPASEQKEDSREYRFLIPDQEDMTFRLSVTARNSDEPDGIFHETGISSGVLSVLDSSGLRYREGSELPAENERVTVRITPDENYCVYGRNVKNNIFQSEMKFADFLKNQPSIIADHPIRPGIFVTLDTDDELGSCAFWTNTDLISGTVMLREGQNLQLDYILDADSGYEVILTPEERAQVMDVWSPYAASREIDVTEELQGRTLRCRDFVTIQKRVKADDITDTY